MKLISIILIALLIQQSQLSAKEFQSGENQVKLIELYSSEGCSSCPPAEDQLAKLTEHRGLWKAFVPINFHVDYWNRLGWTDPYSKAEFTERQRNYAKHWGVKTVYTPAFVSNGESLGPTLYFDELAGSPNTKNIIKLNLKADALKSSYAVKLMATNLDAKKSYQVHIALLGNGLVSDVLTGENEGKKLTQNFVVLKYESKTYSDKGITLEIEQPRGSKASKYSVVAWVTEKDRLTPLQVVGGYL